MFNGGFFIVLILGFIAFILFSVYFIFKQIQFILVSVNLYKKIVSNQETITKILIEIRDQGKLSTPTVTAPRNIENKSDIISPEINQKQTERADNRVTLNKSDDKINNDGLSSLQQIDIYKYKNELAEAGYKLSGSKNGWVIKSTNGTLIKKSPSVDKLKNDIKNIIGERNSQIKNKLEELKSNGIAVVGETFKTLEDAENMVIDLNKEKSAIRKKASDSPKINSECIEKNKSYDEIISSYQLSIDKINLKIKNIRDAFSPILLNTKNKEID